MVDAGDEPTADASPAPEQQGGFASGDTTAHFTDDFVAQLQAMEAGISPEELESIAALPSGSALLIVRRGPNVGARFLLDADVTVAGRHPDADIFLDDVTVSRRHAEFVKDPEGWTISDTGSLNGTYVNKNRIDTHVLASGDEVQIGKYRFLFLQVPAA